MLPNCSEAVVVSSSFKRAKRSAEIMHAILGCTQPLQIDEALNERDFGKYNFKGSEFMNEIRENDAKDDGTNAQHGVEHVLSCLSRMSALVKQMEEAYTNKDVILVSHDDPLRILLAGYAKEPKINPCKYASIKRFEHGEIRRLTDPIVLGN